MIPVIRAIFLVSSFYCSSAFAESGVESESKSKTAEPAPQEQTLKQETQPVVALPVTERKKVHFEHKSNTNDVIHVCSSGCDSKDLQDAVNRVSVGGEIRLAPNVFHTCAVIDKPVHIRGWNGRCGDTTELVSICKGKAALVTTAANIHLENITIRDIANQDGTGACVSMEPGTRDLTLQNIRCRKSQNGLLGSVSGTLLIEESLFTDNGFGNGQGHGIYLTGGDQVVIRRSNILSTQNAGHALKVGAAELTVEDSVIAALNGHNSLAIDAYRGGNITLKNNIIQQGPQSENNNMIRLASEPSQSLPNNHALLAENNWFIFDRSGSNVLLSGNGLGPITLHNNRIVGKASWGLKPSEERNTRRYKNRKAAKLNKYDGERSSLPGQ